MPTQETSTPTQAPISEVSSSFAQAKEISMECFEKLDWLVTKGYVVSIIPVNLRPPIVHLRLEKNHKLMCRFSGPSISMVLDEAYCQIKSARAGK